MTSSTTSDQASSRVATDAGGSFVVSRAAELSRLAVRHVFHDKDRAILGSTTVRATDSPNPPEP